MKYHTQTVVNFVTQMSNNYAVKYENYAANYRMHAIKFKKYAAKCTYASDYKKSAAN